MKPIRYFFVVIAFFIQNVYSLQAQNTEGMEFWLTFSRQLGMIPIQVQYGGADMQIRIVGGSQPTTTGRINFTELGTYQDFTLHAYEIFDYTLTPTERLAVYNDISDNINNKPVNLLNWKLT